MHRSVLMLSVATVALALTGTANAKGGGHNADPSQRHGGRASDQTFGVIDWRRLSPPQRNVISASRLNDASPALIGWHDRRTISASFAHKSNAAGPSVRPFDGFNYVSYYNGGYVNADSMKALKKSGANTLGLDLEYGIDVNSSTVYRDKHYTDSLKTLGRTIDEARSLHLTVMVKPLIDFLDPSKIGSHSVGDWRTYYKPKDPAAFFASYQHMIVSVARVAQNHGATLVAIGTELDQLTGPKYEDEWNGIIAAVQNVFHGQLTYAADWDDAISPWRFGNHSLKAGTGDIATQVSFWNELDYAGIDEYAAISDADNPTPSQLKAGWVKVPTDPTTKSVTGDQSLRNYYLTAAKAIGKPLLFTELGYESTDDAAHEPAGSSSNNFDPQLQADLYTAFFNAWRNVSSRYAGVYFWDWDPNTSEVGPTNGANFSPQGLPALDVVKQNWLGTGETPAALASLGRFCSSLNGCPDR